eukprot:gene6526-10534_t
MNVEEILKSIEENKKLYRLWSKESAKGSEIILNFSNLIIEKQYIDSPNWAVFSEFDNIQQRVEEKILNDIFSCISKLNTAYENLKKEHKKMLKRTENFEEKRFFMINQSKGIPNISKSNKLLQKMKEIQILFSKDLITKGLILKDIQKLQNNQDQISLSVLICYSHSWELQTNLTQCLNIISLIENELETMKTVTNNEKEKKKKTVEAGVKDWTKQKMKVPKNLSKK